VQRLHQAGKSLGEIAAAVGVSKSSVHRILTA
jgi:DNA-binding IclR family transcriptional regulator